MWLVDWKVVDNKPEKLSKLSKLSAMWLKLLQLTNSCHTKRLRWI